MIKHGKYCKDYKNYCLDCGKQISSLAHKCHSCANRNKKQHNKPHTEETKAKISKKLLSLGFMGLWNKGRKFTKQHKEKLSKAHKGKPISEGTRKKLSKILIEVYKNPELKEKMSKISKEKVPRGDKHYRWLNKKTNEEQRPRDLWQAKDWRIKIFERDNYTCKKCGKTNCYLEAHHIKGWTEFPELRYEIDNGITLCKECHKLITFSKENKNESVK